MAAVKEKMSEKEEEVQELKSERNNTRVREGGKEGGRKGRKGRGRKEGRETERGGRWRETEGEEKEDGAVATLTHSSTLHPHAHTHSPFPAHTVTTRAPRVSGSAPRALTAYDGSQEADVQHRCQLRGGGIEGAQVSL